MTREALLFVVAVIYVRQEIIKQFTLPINDVLNNNAYQVPGIPGTRYDALDSLPPVREPLLAARP